VGFLENYAVTSLLGGSAQDQDGKLYTAFTSNVTKGNTEYQDEYAHSTKHCGVLAAIYYELCLNEDEANGSFF
jgi:hypothetical protein